MDDADEKPTVSIDPRYQLTGDVVERPPDERPKLDTIEANPRLARRPRAADSVAERRV
jgi:hypothetical protein